ncbi:MAG: alginate export family protein [Candidatus Omnitrophica bacterium]|nr:alginate export family protein [Candidatus Omnitrophota bacterium]
MKKLMTILAAIMLVGLVVPAFSAVENVKVGGDIVVKGIYRNNFDFTKKIGANGDGESYLYTGARVYVSAELSDNVSALVRFINERDWSFTGRSIDIDLAYVKVSDLVVPGLNLTVGRQEIQIGDGLVVGSLYNAANAAAGSRYYDYGLQKAFDAIKVDYAFTAAPVTVTAFKAKISELYNMPQDSDLYGLDVPIKAENVAVNPYYVRYISQNGKATLDTAGIRATWNPMEALALSGEYAKQFGSNKAAAGNPDYQGWALVLGASYKFDTNMAPVISAMYADFSGQKATSTDVKQWVPVFPSNIASRVGKIAYPALFSDGEGAFDIGGGSGVRVLKLGLGLQPAEKIGLSLDWFNLTAKETPAGVKDSVGNEIDLGMTYQYSEDLSFGLDLGYFITGKYIENTVGNTNDKNAWQAIATMRVAF